MTFLRHIHIGRQSRPSICELSEEKTSFREMFRFRDCATLYSIVARCILFYATFVHHSRDFRRFSRHLGMPLWYSDDF